MEKYLMGVLTSKGKLNKDFLLKKIIELISEGWAEDTVKCRGKIAQWAWNSGG